MINNSPEARSIVKQSLTECRTGIQIAAHLHEQKYSIEETKTVLEEFGFAVAIIAEDENSLKLHVSESIALPGLALLALSIFAKRLPSIEWS